MIWYWNDIPYTLESIKEGNFIATDESMQIAWDFAQSWLSGASTFYLPTSGSTGLPKEIEISRKQMLASAEATAKALNLFNCQSALLALNPQYIGGKMMLVRALEYGLSLTGIPPVGNPFAHLGRQEGRLKSYDFVALVPTQLYNIALETPHLLAYLNGCKVIILGGGSISENLMEIIQTLETPVYNTYGMTETVSHIALRRLNGAGKVAYFTALEGVQLSTDQRACLRIWADATNQTWVQTNDVVELMDSQRFIWKGRADNILNTGGIKVQIEVLEAKIEAILRREGIDIALAIVGVPDEKWQEKIVLFLETNTLPAQLHDKLLQCLKNELLAHEVPKEVIFRQTFIRTKTGKIKRQAFEI